MSSDRQEAEERGHARSALRSAKVMTENNLQDIIAVNILASYNAIHVLCSKVQWKLSKRTESERIFLPTTQRRIGEMGAGHKTAELHSYKAQQSK